MTPTSRLAAFDECHLVKLHPEFKPTAIAAWDQDTTDHRRSVSDLSRRRAGEP